jgi:exopolysaccharide production protein ExoZ
MNTKLNSIQFLRAVAVLLVVYEHSMDAQIVYGVSAQQKFYHLNGFGCIGVDLFFVISGFIITYVANKYRGLDDGLHFLEKRFWRINPVYYIATMLCLGVILLQLQADHNSFPKNIFSSLMDTILLIPTNSEIINFSPLLIIGWTLSFEWLFYVIFFFLIASNVKQKTLALSIVFLLLIGTGQLIKPDDLRLQFITNPILLEFLLGVIICQFYIKGTKVPTWAAATVLIIGLTSYILLIRFGYGNVWYYQFTINGEASLNKFLFWGIPSACIMFGCIFIEKNGLFRHLFDNKLSLLLGDASYSIYLIHFTLFSGLHLIYRKAGFFLPADYMIWLQMIFGVGIALLFYKWIEKPLLKRFHQKTKLISKKKESQPVIPISNPAL